MITLTKQQRRAVFAVWLRTVEDSDTFRFERHRAVNSARNPKVRFLPELRRSYVAFRRTVQPTFGCDDCVFVRFAGMWLGIERDGYTHS